MLKSSTKDKQFNLSNKIIHFFFSFKMSQIAFSSRFYKEYNEITEDLNSITSKSTDPTELGINYEKISNRIQLLLQFFTEYVSHISLYDQRRAQEHINKLSALSAQIRTDLFPKKKFTFKSKKNLTSASKFVEETESQQQIQQQKADLDKKINELNTNHTCTIKDCVNETIIKNEDELLNADIGIINVKNCVIKLYGQPSVIHLINIEDSIILCGPLSGTAFVNNCKNSKINLACHQLRIHETQDTDFYINVASRSIIENCKNVRFAPYAWNYKDIGKHLKTAGTSEHIGDNWTLIDDFNWLVQNQKSPNWSFMDEQERLKWTE
jgi:hypothetical protein